MKLAPIKPFGALMQAEEEGAPISSLDPAAVERALAEHPLLVLRGFSLAADPDYAAFARRFGDLLAWEFGEILELKLQPNPANHIFGPGRVELHWDGAYVVQKPHYNLFQCVQGAIPAGGGETLFVDTRGVMASATAEERAYWKTLTLEYSTAKKAHYGGRIESPLVCRSRFDGREVLRYIEAFNEDNSQVNPVTVKIRDLRADDTEKFLRDFNARLYSGDVMYRHSWRAGDYLIADNSQLLHGRSRFLKPDDQRHIKRINIL